MLGIAILALALQPAQAPRTAASPPPANDGSVTVIERGAEDEDVPLNSRISRTVRDGFAADPVAAQLLSEWADCTVRIHRRRSLALLASPLNSPEQALLIDQMTGHRFTRRTTCTRFRSMRVDNLVLRGAIAESLHGWERRRRQSAGPLAPPSLPPVAAGGPPAALAQMGRCVVERDQGAAERLMATRPGTSSARRVLMGMAAQIDACLPAGRRARNFHPLTLRGAIGEPFYLSKRVLAGARVNPGGATPPGT